MFKDKFQLTEPCEEKVSIISKVTSEDFWKNLRPGVYNEGLITFCDTENYGWNTLSEWTEIIGPKVLPVAFNPWGEVFIISFNDEIEASVLFPQDKGTVKLGANPFVYFDAFLSDEKLTKSLLDTDRFERVKEKHGALGYGQCFILRPYESLGGNQDDIDAYDKGTATVIGAWSVKFREAALTSAFRPAIKRLRLLMAADAGR